MAGRQRLTRTVKHFHLITQNLDVSALRLQIKRQPWLWDRNDMRKTYAGSPHTQMSDIWLRYNAWSNFDAAHPERFGEEHDSVYYPAWDALPAARTLVFDLMAHVQGERLGGILITKIPPGGEIAGHKDAGWHVEYYDKFYIQLDSGPGAEFWCEDEAFTPRRGEVYFLDNTKLHGVRNNSATEDRMTLIVCVRCDRAGAGPA